MHPIPCPFVYKSGKSCKGIVERIEAYRAELRWEWDGQTWTFEARPGTQYHMFCSLKGNHAGFLREDALKAWFRELPDAAQSVVQSYGSEP